MFQLRPILIQMEHQLNSKGLDFFAASILQFGNVGDIQMFGPTSYQSVPLDPTNRSWVQKETAESDDAQKAN